MNDFSKLTLSDEELELVSNTQWILTKRAIMDKVAELFGLLSSKQAVGLANAAVWLPEEVLQTTPKIAKGENYLLLPYQILDHPRYFNGGDIFAVRTMFWWGNYYSVTLHLAGRYKSIYEEKIMTSITNARPDLFICIQDNQWIHHFDDTNYSAVRDMSMQELSDQIGNRPFMKLAVRFPLQSLDALLEPLELAFEDFINLLRD